MTTTKIVYNAEVILTIEKDDPDYTLSEKERMMAAIEAEVLVNAMAYFDYGDDILGVRLHLKGEKKNGDNQNKNLARRKSDRN
jgi:hypothetical protein